MRRFLAVLLALLLATGLSGCTGTDEGDDGGEDGMSGGTGGGTSGGTGDDGGDDGTDDNQTTVPDPITIEVGLSGAYPVNIAYDPATITVTAGQEVTIRFTNDDQNPIPGHDWVLEGYEDDASTPVAANGETVEVTFTAPSEPGDYTFYCSVPGHRGNGMEGTFTVTAA